MPDLKSFVAQMKSVAPRFGEASVFGGATDCVGYPIPPIEPPPMSIALTNVPPVLLIGGTQDASTPYIWASRVAGQIAGSRLLTRTGYGHVSYDKSRCVKEKVDNYFINLTLPPAGTTCPTDPDLYPPQNPLIPRLP